jgi:hypothetical protein
MFLKDKQTDDLIKVLDIEALFNPTKPMISGQSQAGQEEQNPTDFPKESLKFPSGEDLPICWVDENYQQA